MSFKTITKQKLLVVVVMDLLFSSIVCLFVFSRADLGVGPGGPGPPFVVY